MPHERLRPSFTFDEERLKQLQQIAPEAFADGKINWEVLKQALGEQLEEEDTEAEHFGLFWPGKREARKIASIPSKGTLIPVKGEGINEETTKNVFIEGENLEVLKLLQKSYANKIKMIYIDPPYNTGNDFVYDDNFTEPLEEYLKYTGQMDEEGRLLTTNKKADGRFHSKWLSMMYPRLRLARNLLSEDGVIFVSIDDNEIYHLRNILNEVFGEENFINSIIWKKTNSPKSQASGMGNQYESVLAYAKNRSATLLNRIYKPFNEKALKPYAYEDKKGKFRLIELEAQGLQKSARRKRFDFKGRTAPWLYSLEKLIEWDNQGVIYKSKNGRFAKKQYLDDMEGVLIADIWIDSEIAPLQGSSEEYIGFDTQKPIALIKRLLKLGSQKDSLILDFFAGSGTTAEAVWQLNKEDGGTRCFICIQLPELCNKEFNFGGKNCKNVAEICKERIKKCIKAMKNNSARIGVKILKLERSSLKQWQDYKGKDSKELTSLFKEHEIPLIDGWKPENLLIEVMLQEGFPLDSEIAELKEHKKNAVMQVRSEFCEHKLLVCFDKKIYQETINILNIQGEDIFVCLDSAISDEQKITLSDKGFLKTI